MKVDVNGLGIHVWKVFWFSDQPIAESIQKPALKCEVWHY